MELRRGFGTLVGGLFALVEGRFGLILEQNRSKITFITFL
jgi:hypothetical protein